MVTENRVDKSSARLFIRKGYENKKLGITPDMEVGFLYHYKNDLDELGEIGKCLWLSPSWIQARLKGLAHYELWGAPLKEARKLFRVVTREELHQDYDRLLLEYKEAMEEIEQEVKLEDLIVTNLGHVSFVSKSKGRGRRRRNWKEVELFRFAGGDRKGEWHTPRHARLDEMTEIMNKQMLESPISGDDLMWWAKQHCNRNGGKQKGIH